MKTTTIAALFVASVLLTWIGAVSETWLRQAQTGIEIILNDFMANLISWTDSLDLHCWVKTRNPY